jgi:hypothetical protein
LPFLGAIGAPGLRSAIPANISEVAISNCFSCSFLIGTDGAHSVRSKSQRAKREGMSDEINHGSH